MNKNQDINSNEKEIFKDIFEKEGSTSDEQDETAVIPDGGWGWVICSGTFAVNFIVFGIHNSFGVVYANLLDELQLGTAETGEFYVHN